MPRVQTPAHERAAQRAAAKERAAAIVGRDVTHEEAAAILRGDVEPQAAPHLTERAGARSTGGRPPIRTAPTNAIPTPDRAIDLTDEITEPLGRVICRVQDMKVLRGSVVSFSLVTSTEYMNAVTRAALVGGDLLVCDLTQLKRWADDPFADDE